MKDQPREDSFSYSEHPSQSDSNPKGLFLGLWGLACMLLLSLAFFSANLYLKFSGLGGLLAVCLYLIFFRALVLENKFRNLQQRSLGYFTLLESLEEETLYSRGGKLKEKPACCLLDFFGQILQTKTLLVFLKEGEEYRLLDDPYRKTGVRKRTIKPDESLIAFIKRQPGSSFLDLNKDASHLGELASYLKGSELKSVFPLKSGDDLVGFVLFSPQESRSSESGISKVENRMLALVSKKLFYLEKFRELRRKYQSRSREPFEKMVRQTDARLLNDPDIKRRIFDLHSLFQSANQLYLSLDQNRLFFNFIQTLQRQLSAKTILVLLAEDGSNKLKAKYSKGIDFLQFSEICLGEGDPLYQKLKEKESPYYLYKLMEEFQGNELLTSLAGQGFQLCFPLSLPEDRLGLVFLGGKTEGIRYKPEDFLILSFLSDMLNVSLKNITQYRKLEELSYTDSLSGLYNYRYFCKRLNEEILRAKRYQRKLAFVIFDIDKFKIYNDSFGHQSGDQIIKQLGELILELVRSIDVVSRYGGDEFCVIMPETDQEECLKFIERLRKNIQSHLFTNEFLQLEHHLTVSAGAAIYPLHARTSEKLIYYADMALLQAKNSGRNKTLIYSGEEPAVEKSGPLVRQDH